MRTLALVLLLGLSLQGATQPPDNELAEVKTALGALELDFLRFAVEYRMALLKLQWQINPDMPEDEFEAMIAETEASIEAALTERRHNLPAELSELGTAAVAERVAEAVETAAQSAEDAAQRSARAAAAAGLMDTGAELAARSRRRRERATGPGARHVANFLELNAELEAEFAERIATIAERAADLTERAAALRSGRPGC